METQDSKSTLDYRGGVSDYDYPRISIQAIAVENCCVESVGRRFSMSKQYSILLTSLKDFQDSKLFCEKLHSNLTRNFNLFKPFVVPCEKCLKFPPTSLCTLIILLLFIHCLLIVLLFIVKKRKCLRIFYFMFISINEIFYFEYFHYFLFTFLE